MANFDVKTGSGRTLLPYPESLYNISILSFNNIKGEAAIELEQVRKQLMTLERRGAELCNEIKALGVEGFALQRRALATHSEFRLRIGPRSKREYVRVGDEKLKTFLADQPEEMADEMESHLFELVVLNANLKIYWTIYSEFADARSTFGDQRDVVKPSTILDSSADSTDSVA